MAIAPILKLKPFLLYLGLAVVGSLISGYLFEWFVGSRLKPNSMFSQGAFLAFSKFL
jgi:hypothetical protein